MRTVLRSTCLALLLAVSAGAAHAQSLRVVLLPKETREAQPVADSGLDAVAIAALQGAGVRIVDLGTALAAQRFALSDSVQQGKLPQELTVLNADAAISLQLRCARSASQLMATKIEAQQCALDTKVIRIENGDVVFASSESVAGHGLNPQMAIQSLLEKRLPELIKTAANSWIARFTQTDTWELDITVSRVADRALGRALAKELGALPGVKGARLVVFAEGLAKYALTGEGQTQLEQIPDAIDADDKLALTVTYETPRLLHAVFDLAKAYRRHVMVMSVTPGQDAIAAIAPELTRAALMNLPYLEMAHSLPLSATPESARALEERLRARGKALSVPLLVGSTLVHDATGWSAALKLVDIASGRTVAAASGGGATGAHALEAAARAFDGQYRDALGRKETRSELGLPDLAGELVNDRRIVIEKFGLGPPKPGERSTTGMIELRNASQAEILDATLTVTAAGRELYKQEIPPPMAIANAIYPVRVRDLPQTESGQLRVTATVTFRSGMSYERVSAVTSLLLPPAKARPRTAAPKGARSTGAAAEPPKGYTDIIAAAVQKHADGDWEAARDLFLRSHELYPNARTLRALGMVEFDLGHPELAQRYLQEALSSTVRPMTDDQRGDAKRLLARANAGVALAIAAVPRKR